MTDPRTLGTLTEKHRESGALMARVVRRCGFAAWRDTLQETGHRRLTLSLEDVGRSMAQDSASAQARPAADLGRPQVG